MSNDNRTQWRTRFDALAQPASGDDPAFWYARDLLKALGDNGHVAFIRHARRAAAACEAAGKPVAPHCRGVLRILPGAKGDGRLHRDYQLSRYACHLVVMAIDSRRDSVAFAREYFVAPATQPYPVSAHRGDKTPADAAPGQTPEASVEAAPQPSSDAQTSSDAKPPKNSWMTAPVKNRGNPGGGSRFIPGSGGQSQGNRNQNRNASWNPNLAVGRGHPNSAAKNSR